MWKVGTGRRIKEGSVQAGAGARRMTPSVNAQTLANSCVWSRVWSCVWSWSWSCVWKLRLVCVWCG